jgi:UDP:flavonoid glycosyltransferase YjiC (YdhE family)
MVVLPIFWDQHDNAQRVHETGFGKRLDTYSFTDEEISAAIDRLLGDAQLRARLTEVSARLTENPGNVRAAELIEHVAETGEPVTD